MKFDRSRVARKYRRYRSRVVGAVATALLLSIINHARAEETGEWSEFTFLDHAPKTDLISEPSPKSNSLVTIVRGFASNRIGALFADKAQVHTVFFAIGINHSGVKVFTLPTGDQLLLFYEAADIERSDASGRWQFLGGSGFYEGIRGSGTYTAKEIWYDGARIDFFEGAYELPNRYSDQLGSVIQDSLVEDGTK